MRVQRNVDFNNQTGLWINEFRKAKQIVWKNNKRYTHNCEEPVISTAFNMMLIT